MKSVLLISSNAKKKTAVESAAEKADFNFKCHGSVSSAIEQCKLLHFNVVLLDEAIGPVNELKKICTEIWAVKPMTIIGVYSFHSDYTAHELKILGVTMYCGPDASLELENDLEQLTGILDTPGTSAILYVEDLDAPRFIIGSLMESYNLGTIMAVASADEAIDALEKNPGKFFCVVSDLNMPKRDGLWLLRRIRSTAHLASLPVILVTAYGTRENLLNCLQEGVTGFLVKPPKKSQLKDEILKARRIYFGGLSPRLAHPDSVKEMKLLLKTYSLT